MHFNHNIAEQTFRKGRASCIISDKKRICRQAFWRDIMMLINYVIILTQLLSVATNFITEHNFRPHTRSHIKIASHLSFDILVEPLRYGVEVIYTRS